MSTVRTTLFLSGSETEEVRCVKMVHEQKAAWMRLIFFEQCLLEKRQESWWRLTAHINKQVKSQTCHSGILDAEWWNIVILFIKKKIFSHGGRISEMTSFWLQRRTCCTENVTTAAELWRFEPQTMSSWTSGTSVVLTRWSVSDWTNFRASASNSLTSAK